MYSSGTVRQKRFGVQSPHDIIKTQLPKLVNAITAPEKLANNLYSADLISDSIKTKVLTTPGLSQYDKASILMEEVLCSLSTFNDHQTLVSFCTVLSVQDDPILKRLSEEIIN